MTTPDQTDRDVPCYHCGQPRYRHVQITGAGYVCPVSAFSYSPKPLSFDEGLALGASQERARIAAWLREYPSPLNDLELALRIRSIADAIEGEPSP